MRDDIHSVNVAHRRLEGPFAPQHTDAGSGGTCARFAAIADVNADGQPTCWSLTGGSAATANRMVLLTQRGN